MIDHKTSKTFDKLYYDTYNDVLRYVICHSYNVDDVKDIVQNVYLEVIKKLKNENDNISKKYIIGIARNKVNDYYRFKYKHKIISLFSNEKELHLIETIPNNINLEAEFIKKEDLKYVWQFLKKKNVIIFKIFYLYYYDNLSIKEISKELNISESNVKNYLYRTLKELKSSLKLDGDDNDQ